MNISLFNWHIWIDSVFFFFKLKPFYLVLGYSWLTMLWQFRVNSKGTQSYIYLYHICLLLLSHFSHVWLCDPMDGSPPGSPVPGILQARTLEWVAISFSNAWKWKVKMKLLSCVRPSVTPWTAAFQAPPSMGFSRQEYWSGVPLPSPLFSPTKHINFMRARNPSYSSQSSNSYK